MKGRPREGPPAFQYLWQDRNTGRWFLSPSGGLSYDRYRFQAVCRAFINNGVITCTYPFDPILTDAEIHLAYAAMRNAA